MCFEKYMYNCMSTCVSKCKVAYQCFRSHQANPEQPSFAHPPFIHSSFFDPRALGWGKILVNSVGYKQILLGLQAKE